MSGFFPSCVYEIGNEEKSLEILEIYGDRFCFHDGKGKRVRERRNARDSLEKKGENNQRKMINDERNDERNEIDSSKEKSKV